MGKTSKLFFGFFLLLVIFLTYLEATEPEPVNWTPSYMSDDKIPLGSFVFYESWKNNKNWEFEEIAIPPFEKLSDSLGNGTYFFLNNSAFFDQDELHKLLDWVSIGNELFISARSISPELLDTLQLETRVFIPKNDLSSKPQLNFKNSVLKSETYFKFKNEFSSLFFHQKDSAKIEILGEINIQEDDKNKQANFIKSNFGKGQIYLHTTPEAFGNYFLLTGQNYKYAENILAYVNKEKPVFLDNYYKAGKTFYSSPLYILLSNNRLKWAYYFLLAGCVLFIIFEGKRKQRAIPVVNPLKNQSYEYAKTVGDLYLEEKEYGELITKKISLFLEYIRIHYKIPTKTIDEEFHTLLASKSGNNITSGKKLFAKIEKFSNNTNAGKSEFYELSEAINNFKSHSNGKPRK
ncbi:DUF4350 domain-containing protein [Salegentibacter salegens]|uniref:DUF4350 domain-containing protein n=1 Tax=Salegentibacter salegens TaxID=143223 RepID=A0A1M7JM19_9FLAO|nr:DUF4350 domain-containing protein [Salegentibacter salegens]PRX51858.1 uncharacterized protein DUF4350 [Salegentibacter salegens]SHM54048.1 protein of unknown function [Salegentibacter salegens]